MSNSDYQCVERILSQSDKRYYSCAAKLMHEIRHSPIETNRRNWMRKYTEEWKCTMQAIYDSINKLQEDDMVVEEHGLILYSKKMQNIVQKDRMYNVKDTKDSLRSESMHSEQEEQVRNFLLSVFDRVKKEMRDKRKNDV